MFNRRLYKKNALECLRGRRTAPTLVSIAVLGTLVLLNAGSVGKAVQAGSSLVVDARRMNFIVLAILCFVMGTVAIAEAGFYLAAIDRPGEPLSFGTFMDGFSQFIRGFLGFAWKWLWIFVWSMFCVIPGIVKYFAYSQLFYILRDFPELGVARALSVSKEITRGHKAELFWMRLSFLGWDILSLFTMGLLQIWVRPYKQAAFAFAYRALMQRAMASGAVTQDDLRNM